MKRQPHQELLLTCINNGLSPKTAALCFRKAAEMHRELNDDIASGKKNANGMLTALGIALGLPIAVGAAGGGIIGNELGKLNANKAQFSIDELANLSEAAKQKKLTDEIYRRVEYQEKKQKEEKKIHRNILL